MKPEIKEIYVAALRSGDYEQGHGVLRNNANCFCVLGVLCDLCVKAHPESSGCYDGEDGTYFGRMAALPLIVGIWAGIDSGRTEFGPSVRLSGQYLDLASHNDDGRTFWQLANAIESQL